ncbi:TetR/AcrR family transcriptional regulator [Hyphomonadaceae bacterium ML37]|nr:TetR/AcrR family transcriptional regulator [Hyphomonadaceae bacterium ML37]
MQLTINNEETVWPLRRARERSAAPAANETEDANARAAAFNRVRQAVLAQFSRHAFHKVGMRDVAREARCGIAALYRFAETKDDLLSLCLVPDFEARAERLRTASRREVGTRARLRACIGELVRFDLDRPDFARIVRLNTPACLLQDAAENAGAGGVIEDILTRGARDGSVRTDLEPPALASLVCALADGALGRWARADRDAVPLLRERLGQERAELVWAVIWPAVSSA